MRLISDFIGRVPLAVIYICDGGARRIGLAGGKRIRRSRREQCEGCKSASRAMQQRYLAAPCIAD